MVSTRSHDNTTGVMTEAKESRENQSSTSRAEKRKIQNEEDHVVTSSAPLLKRPRVVIPIKRNTPPVNTTHHEVPEAREEVLQSVEPMQNPESEQNLTSDVPSGLTTSTPSSSPRPSIDDDKIGEREFQNLPPALSDESDAMQRADSIAAGENHNQAIASRMLSTSPSAPNEIGDKEFQRLPPDLSDESDAMAKVAAIAAGENNAQDVASREVNGEMRKNLEMLERRGNIAKRIRQANKVKRLSREKASKEDDVEGDEDPPNPSIAPMKRTHKRFDSEEPEPLLSSPKDTPNSVSVTTAPKVNLDENSDSDDEAPEILNASAAQTQARSTAFEEAKASAAQRKEKKRKRRERDARLKEQSHIAKEKDAKVKADSSRPPKKRKRIVVDNDDDVAAAALSSEKENGMSLAEPLPMDILESLESLPPSLHHVPPPPTSTTLIQHKLNKKRKLLDTDDKPPKDIKKGDKIIKVLPESTGALPPKNSKEGKALRERWLMGNRGRSGVSRKEWSAGSGGGKSFVRR